MIDLVSVLIAVDIGEGGGGTEMVNIGKRGYPSWMWSMPYSASRGMTSTSAGRTTFCPGQGR